MDNYTVQVTLKGTNQLTAPVNQAANSIRNLGTQARNAGSALGGVTRGFSSMQTIMGGAFLGVSVAGVTRMAEELYAAGTNAQRAARLFESFGAQIGDTATLMERLRTVTRGAIDDTTLQQAAAQQLSMGLARTATDVERLTNIGVTFAQAMGTDVASSLENLNMLLANQSYLRLDTLGISSSQVRELAAQYRAAGMDTSEAFTAAFLEVAEGKLPQMAAVADATVTEIQKMQTTLDNWWSDFSVRFATGVNALIGIAQNAGPIIRAALFGTENAQVAVTVGNNPQWAEVARRVIADRRVAGDMDWSPEEIAGVIAAAQNAGVRVEDLSRQQISDSTSRLITLAPQLEQLRAEAIATIAIAVQEAGIRAAAEAMLLWREGERGAAGALAAPYQFPFPAAQIGAAFMAPHRNILAPARDARRANIAGADAAGNRAFTRMYELFGENPQGFFFGSDVRVAENLTATIESAAAALERLNADSDLAENMRNAAQLAGQWRDAIAAGAQALENASLSQVFGQTTGGRLGEIDAVILEQMRAQGAGDALIDAMRTALGLDSGQLTGLSLQFDNEIAPQLAAIGRQFGMDALITARRAYLEAVDEAATMGRTDPIDFTAVTGYMRDPNSGGLGEFTVNPGDTPGAIARRTGMTVDQVLAATGARNAYSMMPGTYGAPGGDMTMIRTDIEAIAAEVGASVTEATVITGEMQTAVDTLATGIGTVFGQTYRLAVELVIENEGLLQDLIRRAVVNNGGVVPGTTPNGGRSQDGRATVLGGGR